jgi:hypothetical protein
MRTANSAYRGIDCVPSPPEEGQDEGSFTTTFPSP